MTAQLKEETRSVETISITVTESEMKASARQLYAATTQAGRLDLMQYDADATQREIWFRAAQKFALDRVGEIESAGQPVAYTYVAGI